MWRRLTYKLAPTRKAVHRNSFEEPENTDRNNGILRNVFMRGEGKGTSEIFKCLVGYAEFKPHLFKEVKRLQQEEHIIIFGKQGYGIDLVSKAILGKDNEKKAETSNNGHTHGTTGKENTPSSKNIEFHGSKKNYGRHVKLTFLDTKDKESLSSLTISEEYSVLFCIPVSFRFTTEDLNLLETYLKHRQREDRRRITLVFTYSERLDGETKENYIKNLPRILQDYFTKFGGSYMFLGSTQHEEDENKRNAKRLIKADHSNEYTYRFKQLMMIVVGVYLFL